MKWLLHIKNGWLRIPNNYTAIKNSEFMKFLGKWLELESIILSGGNPFTKEHTWNAVTDKWILA